LTTRGTFRSGNSMFRAVLSARQSAKREKQIWGVFDYTKDGVLYKVPSVRTYTEEEARVIARRMADLNKKPFHVKRI